MNPAAAIAVVDAVHGIAACWNGTGRAAGGPEGGTGPVASSYYWLHRQEEPPHHGGEGRAQSQG